MLILLAQQRSMWLTHFKRECFESDDPGPKWFEQTWLQVVSSRNFGKEYGDRFPNERMGLIWVIVLNQQVLESIGGLDDCGEKSHAELSSMTVEELRKWQAEVNQARSDIEEECGPVDEYYMLERKERTEVTSHELARRLGLTAGSPGRRPGISSNEKQPTDKKGKGSKDSKHKDEKDKGRKHKEKTMNKKDKAAQSKSESKN